MLCIGREHVPLNQTYERVQGPHFITRWEAVK